jgi:hypothetical protein
MITMSSARIHQKHEINGWKYVIINEINLDATNLEKTCYKYQKNKTIRFNI